VAGVLNDDGIAAFCSADRRFDGASNIFAGCLLIDDLQKGKSPLLKQRAPVSNIVDTARQIAAGSWIIIDANAQCEFRHERLR